MNAGTLAVRRAEVNSAGEKKDFFVKVFDLYIDLVIKIVKKIFRTERKMNEREMSSEIGKMSFEEALSALEAIVRQLETGKVKLDDAVDFYAKGMMLRRHCEEKLAAARSRIDKIAASPAGEAVGLTSVSME